MRKRTAFTLLMRGVESGWSVPDDALAEGIATAREILAKPHCGARERIRAAELLANIRQREADRLLKIAELEETIEGRAEIENATCLVKPDEPADMAGLIGAIESDGPELNRLSRAIRMMAAQKSFEAAALIDPADEATAKRLNVMMTVVKQAWDMAGLARLDQSEQLRRMRADLGLQSIDDDGEVIPPIDLIDYADMPEPVDPESLD
jgi:hypothetical protein